MRKSAHQNSDICSSHFGNLTVVTEMMVLDKEADVEVNHEVDKEVANVVDE